MEIEDAGIPVFLSVALVLVGAEVAMSADLSVLLHAESTPGIKAIPGRATKIERRVVQKSLIFIVPP